MLMVELFFLKKTNIENIEGGRCLKCCHCLTYQTLIGFGEENKLCLNVSDRQISNSYTMSCPPVCGDITRGLDYLT